MHAVLFHLLKVFFCSSPSAHLRKTFSNWMFGAFFFFCLVFNSLLPMFWNTSVNHKPSSCHLSISVNCTGSMFLTTMSSDRVRNHTHTFFCLSFVFCHTLGSLCLSQHACREENTTSSAKRRLLCLSRPWIEPEQKQVKSANKKCCLSNSMRRGCPSHCAQPQFCMKSPPMHSLVILGDKIWTAPFVLSTNDSGPN